MARQTVNTREVYRGPATIARGADVTDVDCRLVVAERFAHAISGGTPVLMSRSWRGTFVVSQGERFDVLANDETTLRVGDEQRTIGIESFDLATRHGAFVGVGAPPV